MGKIRILELTGEPIGSGGQEMFIINTIRHIDMSNLQIDWMTPYFCENEIYKNDVMSRGGVVYCMNLPFKPEKARWNLIKPLYYFLKKNKYDVVHIHSGSISILALCSMVARICSVKKIIVHSHSAGLCRGLKYRLIKAFFFPILRFVPTHYCACSKLAGEWKFPQSIIKKKLLLLNNGVDINLFRPNEAIRNKIRLQYGIADTTILVGHVGRFSMVKNHDFMIGIAEAFMKSKYDCKLMFIGEGERLEEIRKIVCYKGLDDFIIFVRATPAVNNYMQAMDVFILPSLWEGLPIVGIEAQCAGIPVLVSNKVSRDVKLVENVHFLPIDNVETWVNAILNLKRGKTDNTQIIKNAGYDINDTAALVRNLYIE